MQDHHAIGKEFDFWQRVRSKKKGSALTAKDFGFQEVAELQCSNRVEAARWFVKQQNFRLVKQRPQQAQPLNCAGRKRASLAIQGLPKLEAFAQAARTFVDYVVGEVIEAAEEAKVLASSQPRVKTQITPCMVAELTTHRRRFANRIMTGDLCAAARWYQQRRQNPKQRGFPRAIGSEQGNRLALLDL